MCELNCHNAQEDQISPVHERKPRFSSFKKSGAIGKAVRNKLNLNSKSSTQSSEKQISVADNSSFEHEKADSMDNGNSRDSQEATSGNSASSKSHPSKVTKKKSKLCLLL